MHGRYQRPPTEEKFRPFRAGRGEFQSTHTAVPYKRPTKRREQVHGPMKYLQALLRFTTPVCEGSGFLAKLDGFFQAAAPAPLSPAFRWQLLVPSDCGSRDTPTDPQA